MRGYFFPAILAVVWNSAERIRAVSLVDRADVDLRGRTITFRHRKQRGPTLRRVLSRSTCRACAKLLAITPHDRPFGHVNLSTVYYHFDRLLTAAGIAKERRNKFHALRRSHASYLKLAGGDAVRSLGHDSEATTQEFYYDPRIVDAKERGEPAVQPPVPVGPTIGRARPVSRFSCNT